MNTSAVTITSAVAIESICAELTEACDRMYADLDFQAGRARAVAGGYEREFRGCEGRLVLQMSVHMESYQVYFQTATDWEVIGEILGRAGIPYTQLIMPNLDREWNKKTGSYSLDPNGGPHDGDYSFGTIGGRAISVLEASQPPVFSNVHPAQQIVDAARGYMEGRELWEDQLAASPKVGAVEDLVRRGYGGGCAGKDRPTLKTTVNNDAARGN